MSLVPFRIVALHPKALLLEWEQEPSDHLLEQLLGFKQLLQDQDEVSRCTMGYKALILHLSNDFTSLSSLKELLYARYKTLETTEFPPAVHWKIPVCYEETHAPDLASLAQALNKTPDEVIQLHTTASYRICFIGFLPGFLYLNGLSQELFLPRKEKPLLKVPKGAVAIGGKQTGIYPNESPGGWHLIGNTPSSFFDSKKSPPCFAKAGDWISFDSINYKEYLKIEEQMIFGKFKISTHG